LNGKTTDLTNSWYLEGTLFETGNAPNNNSNNNSNTNTNSNSTITNPLLYSNDLKVYLGKLTTNKYDSESVFNTFGTYGNKYSTNSISNEFGTYGGKFSTTSAFNDFATSPPAILLNGKIIGYVSTNTSSFQNVHPNDLENYLFIRGY